MKPADMLDKIKDKMNTDILYNVVIFSGTATSTGWKDVHDDASLTDTKENFVNKETTSGTNLDAGIEEATAQMSVLPEEYKDASKYLVTLSDGITYVWTEEGTVKCVPIEGLGANGQVETTAQNGTDTWTMDVRVRNLYRRYLWRHEYFHESNRRQDTRNTKWKTCARLLW